jgi:hypothetical protein
MIRVDGQQGGFKPAREAELSDIMIGPFTLACIRFPRLSSAHAWVGWRGRPWPG